MGIKMEDERKEEKKVIVYYNISSSERNYMEVLMCGCSSSCMSHYSKIVLVSRVLEVFTIGKLLFI